MKLMIVSSTILFSFGRLEPAFNTEKQDVAIFQAKAHKISLMLLSNCKV